MALMRAAFVKRGPGPAGEVGVAGEAVAAVPSRDAPGAAQWCPPDVAPDVAREDDGSLAAKPRERNPIGWDALSSVVTPRRAAATPLTSAKEVAMTTWLLVLVPLTALLIWACLLDRKGNLGALASDHPADPAARRAGVHPEHEDS